MEESNSVFLWINKLNSFELSFLIYIPPKDSPREPKIKWKTGLTILSNLVYLVKILLNSLSDSMWYLYSKSSSVNLKF